MDYSQTIEYIHSLGLFSLPASLERIKECLKKLGDPQNDFESIHIAGTNGKGSVCAMLSCVFGKAGYKVGRFVSPYIIDFEERIQIGGQNIPKSELCRLAQRIIDTNVRLSEFEFITALGFLYFSEQKVDIAIVETGLGGRFDATNALRRKSVAVITKIGLDHMAVLGDTIEKIAEEKCGIINCPRVVTSSNQPKGAMEVIKRHSDDLEVVNIGKAKILSCDITGNEFVFENERYLTSLWGEYQIENAIVAITAIKKSGIKISADIIKQGLKEAFIPARAEVISRCPLIVIDGAHNIDGARELKKIMQRFQNITVLFGAMRDKAVHSVIEETFPLAKRAIAVKADASSRAASAEQIAELGRRYCPEVYVENDLEKAVLKAGSVCGDGPVFIYGSLYLAANIRRLFNL